MGTQLLMSFNHQVKVSIQVKIDSYKAIYIFTESVFPSTKEFIIYETSSKEVLFSMEPSAILTSSVILTTATNNIDSQSMICTVHTCT